ncbi:MAG: site-2 protease family protein [Anaerolineales bacterium]|nr:site-2 protease family protein [Anaerolineales bacterium]
MLGLEPATLIARAITLVIAFTVHELAHALAATWFGDDTPRLNGRLTLNPLAHLDPMGSLLLLFAGFGWAKPTPVNPYALGRRSPAAMMWVSLAGPASNLLLAVLAAVPVQLGLVSLADAFGAQRSFLPTPSYLLLEFIYINLLLMLFNLIPLAPLDGDKIAEYFLPPNLARAFDAIRPYGPVILIVLVLVLPMVGIDFLGIVIGRPLQALFGLLVG